jgi:hypothetical protein
MQPLKKSWLLEGITSDNLENFKAFAIVVGYDLSPMVQFSYAVTTRRIFTVRPIYGNIVRTVHSDNLKEYRVLCGLHFKSLEDFIDAHLDARRKSNEEV